MALINYNLHDTSQPVVNSINKALPKIPIAILVFGLGYVLIKLVSHLLRVSLSITKLPRGLQEVITNLADVALWIFLVIGMLQFLGLNNIALAVTGSFAFITLGLSQGGAAAISDVIGGLALGNDRDFNVGDYIKIGDKSAEGTVEEIDLRRVRLRDREGRMHVVPNSLIDKSGWILLERGHTLSASGRRLHLPKPKGKKS